MKLYSKQRRPGASFANKYCCSMIPLTVSFSVYVCFSLKLSWSVFVVDIFVANFLLDLLGLWPNMIFSRVLFAPLFVFCALGASLVTINFAPREASPSITQSLIGQASFIVNTGQTNTSVISKSFPYLVSTVPILLYK